MTVVEVLEGVVVPPAAGPVAHDPWAYTRPHPLVVDVRPEPRWRLWVSRPELRWYVVTGVVGCMLAWTAPTSVFWTLVPAARCVWLGWKYAPAPRSRWNR